MSSVEEQNDDIPFVGEQKSSIRLSTLNPKVREKVVKFDTANDGELSLEEAIQGLITLQKQSNNYKKIVYLLIPLMTIMLGCVLGVNILAINLTKEIEISKGTAVLTNTAGKILSTGTYSRTQGIFDWLMNGNYEMVDSINIDTLRLKVDSMYLQEEANVTTIYFNTPILWFSISSNGTYNIEKVEGEYKSKVYNLVEDGLKEIQWEILNVKSLNTYSRKLPFLLSLFTIKTPEPPKPAAAGGFGCGKTKCYG